MGYTKQKILNMAETEDVEFIRLQFTDLFGTLKNVAITKSQLAKALDNKIMFDGSSIEGFARIEESDMYLYPDYDTFEILPFRPHQGKVARMICDVYKPDGTQLENDPRYILKKVLKEAYSLEEVIWQIRIFFRSLQIMWRLGIFTDRKVFRDTRIFAIPVHRSSIGKEKNVTKNRCCVWISERANR